MNTTERILEQGQALVRAIVWLLLQAYRRRLRAIVGAAPAWLAEEILNASQRIGKDRAAVWLSENQ